MSRARLNAHQCRKVLAHNDFSWAHILLGRTKKHVTGIIDFSDKAITDPAYDFSYFWDIDESLLRAVYVHYKEKDPTLLLRSLLRRKRGSISWLAYQVKSGNQKSFNRAYRQFKKVMKLKV